MKNLITPRRAPWLLTLALLAATACDDAPPQPALICHNANCVEPANPAEDDTPEALSASLALVDTANRPLIDGVEIDTFWFGEESRCLFAHDLADPETSQDVDVAFDLISAHLLERRSSGAPLTRTAARFSIFIELKGHVGPAKSEKHSPEQRIQHAECAASLGLELAQHATQHDYPLEIVYTSFDAGLLEALSTRDVYDRLRQNGSTITKLGYLVGVPAPLDSQSKPLDTIPKGLDIDVLSAHPHWTRHPTLEAAESMGWELSLWMFTVVPETFDAISTYNPHYVTTSEANVLSGWLDQNH